MFRPPTSIHDLPDELLLNIGAHFINLDRNRDLSNLALVSKRWRPIAQEWLLKEPRFNLTYIVQYMWEIGHRPYLLPQVRSLEIWSTSEGRIKHDERGIISLKEYTPITAPHFFLQHVDFVRNCAEIIAHFADTERHKRKWLAALHENIVPALFGVLLCTLPSLVELKVGDGWLMDFPIFSTMLSREAKAHLFLPLEWKHTFLTGALTTVLPRLKVLEVAADMTCMYFHSRVTALFDFRGFQDLREIGLTMRALQGWARLLRSPPDPEAIFPKTLEVLRISEATEATANFLNNLCLAKKLSHFPALQRVEVYHTDHLEETEACASLYRCPHPVEDVRVMFKDAGVALYLYFPSWGLRTWEAGGTPWRLKTEQEALQRGEEQCFEKGMGPFGVVEDKIPVFEAEWDCDGDAVMI